MDTQTLNEIIGCLPRERTLFRYYSGRFACFLMAHAAARYGTVAALKSTCFGRLVQRPEVRNILASQGHGELNPEVFMHAWQEPSFCFRLGLGRWSGELGRYDQVSRRGVNLVLQLNFSNQHNRAYRRLFKPTVDNVFNLGGHPAAFARRGAAAAETLAWSRIDLDFACDEALIEEIQSDWVRLAAWELEYLRRCERADDEPDEYFSSARLKDQIKYFEDVLPPYQRIWQEAMLAASLWFIREELGLSRVFMHTAQSGGSVKRISGRQPPRSIYADLPRKFCFDQRNEAPEFLAPVMSYRRLSKKKSIHWNYLAL